jgi:hypothetical protein
MTKNCLMIAALSFGLAVAAGAASATPLVSASKTAMVFDGSEAGVQLVHRRAFRRHGRFRGPSVSFGFGLRPYPYYGYPYYGPRSGFGLSFHGSRFGGHGFRSHSGGQGQGR